MVAEIVEESFVCFVALGFHINAYLPKILINDFSPSYGSLCPIWIHEAVPPSAEAVIMICLKLLVVAGFTGIAYVPRDEPNKFLVELGSD